MSVMNLKYLICFLLCCIPYITQAKQSNVKAIKALTARLLPSYAEYFVFKEANEKGDTDYFVLESTKDGRILISGNNANSMAMGLNYYLKYYCKTTVSWYADISVEMPQNLPQIEMPVSIEAKVPTRFFLNYCTYGYTMPFWQWRDWERLIDWMALNGINMPLAITGQEAVWYEVWKKMGLTDSEIRSYFTGPTYLPWHRMANIDGWNGPLPMHWLDHQRILQQKILSRERELNMRPVLPAFSGHVPGALKRLFPEANIQYLGNWAGFSDDYRCHFLNPEDVLFSKIQKMYLEIQTNMYGSDHIYGVDPFNEVDPPSWEPNYLSKVSSDMYNSLKSVDPEAEWLQMTWMFYYDSKKWTPSRIKALLTGAPQDKMILLDYHCENVELWKTTEGFHGQPYIWCYLGNFGGNTTLTGNVRESGKRLDYALEHGGDNLYGVGATLEGLDVNQFPFEYVFEKAWDISISDSCWVNALADRHIGEQNVDIRNAWQILFNDIFTQVPSTFAILPCCRPMVNNNFDFKVSFNYDNKTLFHVWKLLLSSPSVIDRDAYNLDVITVGRQVLGNYFIVKKKEFDELYNKKDLEGLKSCILELREIIMDIDAITSFHPNTDLRTWLNMAREFGTTSSLKNYYERDARNLITTWGGILNDYASRCWSGLLSSYYLERWNIYFDMAVEAIERGHSIDPNKLQDALSDFENQWVNSVEQIRDFDSKLNLVEMSRNLLQKYESKIR